MATVEHASSSTRDVGEGSCQQTGYRRPHVRHSYWPCDGHIGSACITLHQRSAIRAWAGFIELRFLIHSDFHWAGCFSAGDS